MLSIASFKPNNILGNERNVMTTLQSWCYLLGITIKNLTKDELLLVEAEVFIRVTQEIKTIFREKHKSFFALMHYTMEMEEMMIESNFLRLIIQDIIASEEYDMKGIAYYTHIPEEVVNEIMIGLNTNPSAAILQRLINLHCSVRKDLYQSIYKKIALNKLEAA